MESFIEMVTKAPKGSTIVGKCEACGITLIQTKIFLPRCPICEESLESCVEPPKEMSTIRILPLTELFSYTNSVYVEFREFPSANTCLTVSFAMQWVEQVFKHYEIKNPQYGKHYRFWTERPTDEEREAAEWES